MTPTDDLDTLEPTPAEQAARREAARQRAAELVEVLKDIMYGADMMLQPGVATGAFASYAREVKRVAKAALS